MNRETGRIPVTAIILTLNEERNISRCLECLARVDDTVIVDSLSADDTLDAARRARPDVRIFEHPFQDFGAQRNWALDNVDPAHEWILFVDADEFCDDALMDEIDVFIRQPDGFVGAYVAGRNYFLGRWLKRTTMYPSYQLRLLKSGHVRYRKEGHGQKEETDGPLQYLLQGWRHEGFSKGVHQWIARHNDYSSEEVELILRLRSDKLQWGGLVSDDAIARRRAWKTLGAKLPMRPLGRFLYTYVLRLGFLDGYPGFLYCCLRVAHDFHIVTKLAEHRYRGSEPG